MYVQVKTIDGKTAIRITISRSASVLTLKEQINEAVNVDPSKQRLFYRGKQLENIYTIFDYNINLNDVIQLIIQDEVGPPTPVSSLSSNDKNVKSKYFEVGEKVDAMDDAYGAWFEGTIEDISEGTSAEEPMGIGNFLYRVRLDGGTVVNSVDFIRPLQKKFIRYEQLKVGQKVLLNYNIENPGVLGFWYDFLITELHDKLMTGEIYIGRNQCPLRVAALYFDMRVLEVEKLQPSVSRMEVGNESECGENAENKVCEFCFGNPNKKCRECCCIVCGGKNSPETQLLCDECDAAYHLACLKPPLASLPDEEEWYCPSCKNDANEIVQAGGKLKESKKKARMPSKRNGKSRDWGKGMACVGRTKVCTIVPSNHFGPIPGVEVGMCWKFRFQVSESGVHRPPVAGIHGRDNHGAFSVVLSGGYEDDVDDGDTFIYTGSGGRDLSGNKRVAEQSCDQTLTRMNKALALNCNAKLNPNGNEAIDWQGGKPVRVVRNYKAAKHSKYAPPEGNRYDGIYKVVKYYPEEGKSGFKVWRYIFRRDDPAPAPWTKEGKKKIKSQGLDMIYPDGYLETNKTKGKTASAGTSAQESKSTPSPAKKPKLQAYKLDVSVQKCIDNDVVNKKLWDECIGFIVDGKQKFLAEVKEQFVCICCQELVVLPVTTKCGHNFCHSCLKRAFQAKIYTCPCCREDLGENFKMLLNDNLSEALIKLFPGYNAGR